MRRLGSHNRISVRLLLGAFLLTLLAAALPFSTQAADVEYVYFDLSAGNVTITGSTYKGYRYDGNETAQEYTGTLATGAAYYVYQSNGNKQTGYVDGVLMLPTHTPVTYDGMSWGDYVTDNSDVEAVIGAWLEAADAAGRKATSNRIAVTGKVNSTIVIDNIYSSFHEYGTGRKNGGISFIPNEGNSVASSLTIGMIGDNRLGNIYYGTGTATQYSLIFEEKVAGSTLTVANLQKNSNKNYWNSAIGASDNTDHSKGIIINSGTIFAGTNAKDDCTAIGAGGNGYGIVTINGGRVTATVASSGAAIGGGIGKTSHGGQADVTITGGEVYAYNFSCVSSYSNYSVPYIPAAAIGGGSSARVTCNPCTVTVTGGKVYAQSVGGTAIGGGSSSDNNGGSATINISGGEITAKSISGKVGTHDVPAGVAIGGGTGGKYGNGGSVTFNLSGNTVLNTGSIGGGSTIATSSSYKIGHAIINIGGGTLSGQFIMAAGASNPCKLDMTGGEINNGSIGEGFEFLQPNGGAIYMDDPDGVATVSGGVIRNCGAQNGGALYMSAGSFIMSGTALIENCSAVEEGGAVYLGGGTLTVNGGTIQNNTAKNGGSIALAAGTMTINDGTISLNNATQNGGVAYLKNGTMNVEGGTITENHAIGGGAIYLFDGTMNVEGGTITENYAIDGGAIYLFDGTMNVTGGDIYKNSASQNGGVAYLGGGTMNVGGGNIYRNTATQYGGVAYLGGGTMNVSGGKIYENGAVDENGVSTEIGTVDGGAFYLLTGEMYVTGGEIYKNIATQNGGAAYLGGGSLSVSGGSIFQNSAVNGGGFYIMGGGLTVSGAGTIYENEALDSGGGAFVDGGNVTVTGGSILKNTAANVGGGIAINNGNYRMTGGAVNENRAENGRGGGIYIASSGESVTVDVLSGSICQNYSGEDGGAIAVVGLENAEQVIADPLSEQSIKVTIGVNKHHVYDVGDGSQYPNVDVTCDHDGDGHAELSGCPVVQNNVSLVSGGGIFISGGSSTKLSIHCLIEKENTAADGTGNSNFMMVEGGYILVDTCQPDGEATNWGFVVMNSSIHVDSGDVDVFGGMSNPLIESDITIDIINRDEGSFDDERKDDGLFFKVQYYENFDGTGRYRVFSAKKGETIRISGILFSHNGYDIVGWNTQPDGKGSGTYTVNDEYTFGNGTDPNKKYITESLVVYAIWDPRGYFIVFEPNVPSGVTIEGTMPNQALIYGEEANINSNQFIYPGYRFVGWISDRTAVAYDDCGKVLNLSDIKGDEIVFRAQWEECEHKHYESFIFTRYGAGGVLERMCPCHGYTETATLTVPEGAVYNGQPHDVAPPDVKYVSLNRYTIPNANWELSIVYSGDKLLPDAKPTNAGYYTVTITPMVGDKSYSAYLTFYIDKAQQPLTPAKPTYNVSGTQDNQNTITVNPPNPADATGCTIQYQLQWYEGDVLKQNEWGTAMDFSLPTSYTNSFVYARYAEEMNYYPSAPIRADWVYYYRAGNVSIQLMYDVNKMDCRLEELSDEDETAGGLMIHVAAKMGYYLTSGFSVTPPNEYDTIQIDEKVARAQYHLYGLPTVEGDQTLIVQITIDGVAVSVQPTSRLDAGEIFGTVSGETATITRDSAYTAYFEITQYDGSSYTDMRLEFGEVLPIGTTLILLDKTTGTLWYYVVENQTVSKVSLTAFSRMGSSVPNDTFSVSGDTLKYQFVISFSRVAEDALIRSQTLNTVLTATQNDDDGDINTPTCIPALQSSVSVTLAATPTFSITVTETATFERELQIHYAAVENGAVASKWAAFGGAIVLESVGDALPSDVHVQVFEGIRMTTYYQNAQGKFVIPITSRGVTTLRILLISNAFPSNQKTYRITAKLYTACSNASSAPMGGAVKQTVELIYEKPMEPQPALKVTGTQRVISFDESLTVHVNYQGVPQGGKVEVELWAKDNYGVYSNTATTPGTPANDSDYTTATFEGFANNENRYSYCLMFFVKDGNGNTVLTVPYYFIVYDVK